MVPAYPKTVTDGIISLPENVTELIIKENIFMSIQCSCGNPGSNIAAYSENLVFDRALMVSLHILVKELKPVHIWI